MKLRLLVPPVLIGALLATTTGASAAPKTLDGKKVKKLTLTASGGTQHHEDDFVTEQTASELPDHGDCVSPRCAKLPFVYKPARGVNGNVMFTITWTQPLSDFDLYVAQINRDGSTSTLEGQNCGSATGTSEKVFVPKSVFRPGKTYALVVDFFRSVDDTVTGTVEMGVPSAIKDSIPDEYEGTFPGTPWNVDCAE
jgi:hypothetical protein